MPSSCSDFILFKDACISNLFSSSLMKYLATSLLSTFVPLSYSFSISLIWSAAALAICNVLSEIWAILLFRVSFIAALITLCSSFWISVSVLLDVSAVIDRDSKISDNSSFCSFVLLSVFDNSDALFNIDIRSSYWLFMSFICSSYNSEFVFFCPSCSNNFSMPYPPNASPSPPREADFNPPTIARTGKRPVNAPFKPPTFDVRLSTPWTISVIDPINPPNAPVSVISLTNPSHVLRKSVNDAFKLLVYTSYFLSVIPLDSPASCIYSSTLPSAMPVIIAAKFEYCLVPAIALANCCCLASDKPSHFWERAYRVSYVERLFPRSSYILIPSASRSLAICEPDIALPFSS